MEKIPIVTAEMCEDEDCEECTEPLARCYGDLRQRASDVNRYAALADLRQRTRRSLTGRVQEAGDA